MIIYLSNEVRMKYENPLDKHLAINKNMPNGLRDAATELADLLDLAWMTAQSVFEERATPEIALEIFDRLLSRWQQQLSLTSPAQEHE
jgi:hypothetical protein